MNQNAKRLFASVAALSLLVAAGSLPARADDAVEKHFPVPGHGDLVMHVPAEWGDISVMPPAGSEFPAMIEFTGKDKAGSLNIKIIPVIKPGKAAAAPPTDEQLKAVLASMSGKYATGSKEGKLIPIELKSDTAHGYYGTFTDASADAGEFRCVTVGTIVVKDVFVTLTVMHQEKSDGLTTALDALKAATLEKAKPGAATKPADVSLSLKGKAWALAFKATGYQPVEDSTSRDGKSRKWTAMNPQRGGMITIFLEPAEKAGDAKAVRDFYWGKLKQAPLDFKDVTQTGDAKAAKLSYTVADGPQFNEHVYMANDGVWIDVHVSQIEASPADRAAIDALIDSVHVAEKAK